MYASCTSSHLSSLFPAGRGCAGCSSKRAARNGAPAPVPGAASRIDRYSEPDVPPHLSGPVVLVLRQRRQLELVLAGPLLPPAAARGNVARVQPQLPRRGAHRLVLHPLLLRAVLPSEHGLRPLGRARLAVGVGVVRALDVLRGRDPLEVLGAVVGGVAVYVVNLRVLIRGRWREKALGHEPVDGVALAVDACTPISTGGFGALGDDTVRRAHAAEVGHPPRCAARQLHLPPLLSGLIVLVLRQRCQLELVLARFSSSSRAAALTDAYSTHSPSEPCGRLSTDFDCLGACDLRSALVSNECWTFSERVTHSRLSAQLLAGSPRVAVLVVHLRVRLRGRRREKCICHEPMDVRHLAVDTYPQIAA
eukprot:scaffold20696_cov61-Phaeocystis_antarctica.AAC.5